MAYQGYYINLDRSTDRRAAMEAQLACLGLTQRYHRFAAIDGAPLGFTSAALTASELGCVTSHYAVLRQHLGRSEHLHIIEDDAVLATRAAPFLEHIIASGRLDEHDLLFTDMAPPPDLNFYREASSRFDSHIRRAGDGTVTDIRFSTVAYYACTGSYLVNGQSIGLIHDLLERELTSGASCPIDVLIRDKVAAGELRARCLFPFITTVRPAQFDSTIARDDRDRHSALAVDLLRHAFFVECDWTAALDLAERHLPAPSAGSRDRLLARALAFITSEAFQPP